MNKAVFLDRDGVINNDEGQYYIWKLSDFVLNRGIIELLSWLKSKGFMLILISNQGGISKAVYSYEDTETIHLKLGELLLSGGIKLDEIYYCPHHPDNERCICRKPGTVFIEKAVSRYSIDINESFLIGDRETDMEAGVKSGLRTIKVVPNQDMSLIIPFIEKTMKI